MLGFFLALLPLLIVLAGILFARQSGARMAVVGWAAAMVMACTYFETPLEVAFGATAYGMIKAMKISMAVVLTMLMIFLMRETGALKTIADAIKRVARTREEQALFIGMGFGSFVTALGALTIALFPPLLMALGFTPFGAVSVAVLGYDPLTSFALLSLPITIPAGASAHMLGPENAFTASELAYRISIFLPLVSVALAFAMLWVIGGKAAMKRGFVPALISGLVISLSALGFTYFEILPVRIVGIVSGLLAMISLITYQKLFRRGDCENDSPKEPVNWPALLRAASPWLMLMVVAGVISVPPIQKFLAGLSTSAEKITVFADQKVDLSIFSQIYFWILVVLILSTAILAPSKNQIKRVASVWIKNMWGPFIAFSVYFSIAYVMFFSAMEVNPEGMLAPGPEYQALNMDVVVGTTLAKVFGFGFVFVAASLGLFGAVVGGSETASNIMFMKVQHKACMDIGLTSEQFMTVYGSHATGGGIASAMTPAKINGAVAMLDDPDRELEGRVMRKHVVIAFSITILVGLMTGIVVGLG